MRVKPTDHIASGVAPAGAPAGKKAPLKQTAALSGAHRHGKHTLPGLTGTGPGINPLGLTTNVRQVTRGGGVNPHDQRMYLHLPSFTHFLLLSSPATYFSMQVYDVCGRLYRTGLAPSLPRLPHKHYTWVEFLP